TPHDVVQVAATSDGWVSVAPLDLGGYWRPKSRMYVTGREAIEWAARTRSVLVERLDSLAPPDSAALRIPQLSRGPASLVGARRIPGGGPSQHNLSFGLCSDPGYGYDVADGAWLQLVDAVERAGRRATALRGSARAPTLQRPYYESEVSCAARPRADNPRPVYPRQAEGWEPAPREVGVRFVVDTNGRVEPGSISILPDTPAPFAAAARATVRQWRYIAARWASWPVRQVVHVVLGFDPDVPSDSELLFAGLGGRFEPRILFAPLPDGWVQVTHGTWSSEGALTGGREWFPPDTLRAWLKQVEAQLEDDAASPKIWRRGAEGRFWGRGYDFRRGGLLMAGYPMVADVPDSVSKPDSVMHLRAMLAGCVTEVGFGELIDSAFLAKVRHSADAAVRRRSTIAALPDRVYAAGEVACPAAIVRAPIVDPRLTMDAAVDPTGPRSAALDSSRVRAEVMTSFVVDTLGRVEDGTLVVMPGSDLRAIAALRSAIARYEFTPATRAGQRVRQRVIRTWVFVPAPKCEREDAAIDCPRIYSGVSASPEISSVATSAPRDSVVTKPAAASLPPALDTSVVVTLGSSVDSVALRRGTGGLVVRVLADGGRLVMPAQHGRVQLADPFRRTGGGGPCGALPDTATIRDGSALFPCAPGGVHELRAMSIGMQRDQWAVRVRPGFTDTVHVLLHRNRCDIACAPFYLPDETAPACGPPGPFAEMFRRSLIRLVTDTATVADERRAQLRVSRVPVGDVQQVLDAPTCARALAVRKGRNPLARGPVYLFRIGPTRYLLIARNEHLGEWMLLHVLDESFASLVGLTM
ncbi:MAG TPA: hypothetical protein VHM30_03560, partial [Gemmatimonadaceae bacterium]|nr:hypothetical protein [Gemmatimonadaceae bacterium]